MTMARCRLVLLFAAAWCATAQPVAEELRRLDIPVVEVENSGSAAVAAVRYPVSAGIEPDRLYRHTVLVFSRLAAAYPSSQRLEQVSYVEDKPVSRLSVEAGPVRAFLRGAMPEGEMMAQVAMSDLISIDGAIDGAITGNTARRDAAIPPPEGAPLFPWVLAGLMVAGGTYLVMRYRRRAAAEFAGDPPLFHSAPAGEPASGAGASNCARCGCAIEAGEAFCGGCGAPARTVRSCRSCGAEMPLGKRFCTRCGTSLEGAGRSPWLLAGLGAAAAVLLFWGGVQSDSTDPVQRDLAYLCLAAGFAATVALVVLLIRRAASRP